jgi:hypothetical protein
MNIKSIITDRIKASKLTKVKKNDLIKRTKAVKFSLSQKCGMKEALKAKSHVVGQRVILICNEIGEKSDFGYKGVIVKISKVRDGLPLFRVEWDYDSKVTSVWMYQVEFENKNIYIPAKIRAKMVIKEANKELLKRFEIYKSGLNDRIESYKREVRNYQDNIKKNKKEIKEKELLLSGIIKPDVEKDLALIKELKPIEKAYIADSGNIIILTKEIKTSPQKYSIGKFLIKIYKGGSGIEIENRTKSFRSDEDESTNIYSHPNIENGNVCWGSHGGWVTDVLRSGRYLQLIDFVLTFLSTYPHDGGNPYIDFNRWIGGCAHEGSDTLFEPDIK